MKTKTNPLALTRDQRWVAAQIDWLTRTLGMTEAEAAEAVAARAAAILAERKRSAKAALAELRVAEGREHAAQLRTVCQARGVTP